MAPHLSPLNEDALMGSCSVCSFIVCIKYHLTYSMTLVLFQSYLRLIFQLYWNINNFRLIKVFGKISKKYNNNNNILCYFYLYYYYYFLFFVICLSINLLDLHLIFSILSIIPDMTISSADPRSGSAVPAVRIFWGIPNIYF